MTEKTIEWLAERIEREFLPYVTRPARYIGEEVNQVRKDLSACELTMALCFPDIYEIGMSNSGLAILYHILNQLDDVAAERVFSPWTDAEQVLRRKRIPLFSLESKASLRSFEVIGFSLTNELCYTNVLNVLDLAGLEVRRERRREDDPLVIAGGGMANCCEPIAPFIDLFVLGEAEQAVVELTQLLLTAGRNGLSKEQTLVQAAQQFPWVYVPQLYEFTYDDSRIESFRPLAANVPPRIENAVVEDFENAPVPAKPIVPYVEAVHERVSVEIMRGCPGRCRFCQASFCRRPVRFRSVERVLDLAKIAYAATGFDTVSLLSLSSADYPDLEGLVGKLQAYFKDKHVGLSVPSLRVDQQLKLVPKLLTSVRKSGLTIAVEAASERLREIINKPLKNSDLFAATEAAYRAGWQKLKLYFMVGLPGETLDDVRALVELCDQLAKLRRTVDGKTGTITITVSWFVPKPHTPFQWLPQSPRSYFQQARVLILDEKRRLRAKYLQFKFHHIDRSVLESAVGRADRRCADVIESAWRSGARFDLWDDVFDAPAWQAAFAAAAMDLDALAQRRFAPDDILPWDHLGGPAKSHLLTHHADALRRLDGHPSPQQALP
jgi:radical SAM family uncharacterized protein